MNEGCTVFAQLLDFLPKYEFDKCVARYHGNFRVRKLPTYEQFLVLAFAQLTWRESLRDIETCLASFGPKLYHAGIRQPTARSTLAVANEKRDWRIFADFAQVLIRQATTLYADEPFRFELQAAAYALDATTIDLCLSLFPWATFRRHKAAIKLHTLLTLQGNFPTVIIITPGSVHDVNILDQLVWEAGSFYIMDRGYLDFARLHRLHQGSAFFVTRAKQNFRRTRRYSRSVDKTSGLRFDQTVLTAGFYAHRHYPDPLRRIGYRDPKTGLSLVFLTNNFTVPALTIAQLYRGGVRVRLIVDAVGSFGLGRGYFDELVATGGAMRWFNELRLASFSFRDHRKLLVLDDTQAFVGGCNIAPEYGGDGITAGWRDGGVSVRGPVAAVLAVEFDRQWERASGQHWTFPHGGVRQRAPVGGGHEVEALFIKPGFRRNPLRDALWQDLATAKDVAITVAYFLPPHRLRHRLAQAVARGARVRVLLAGKSDVGLMQLASRSLYRRLVQKGIALWEYQPQVLHAKSIVADDIVFVGSSNLDPRSLRINFEIMLRIQDAALAATARQQFESDLAQRAIPITCNALQQGRSWWERLKQRLAYWLFARLDPELAALKLQAWHLRKDRFVRRVNRVRRDGARRLE